MSHSSRVRYLRQDGQAIGAIAAIIYGVALALHLTDVVHLPPILFWTFVAGLAWVLGDSARRHFDQSYRAKRREAWLKVQERGLRISPAQLRIFLGIQVVLGISGVVISQVAGGFSLLTVSVVAVVTAISIFIAHRVIERLLLDPNAV